MFCSFYFWIMQTYPVQSCFLDETSLETQAYSHHIKKKANDL